MTDEAAEKPKRLAFKYKIRQKKLEFDQRTLDQIANIAAHDHTLPEAAAMLAVSRTTLTNFLAKHPEAQQAWTDGKREGRAMFRRLGFVHAKNDPSTWRFLAKQGRLSLGYEDKPDAAAAAVQNVQVNITVEEAQKRVQELVGKVSAPARPLVHGLPPPKQSRQR